MEIHSVLPEERARDEKGDPLPWGYRYADSSRNPRQQEESGPFGRNRSVRLGSRASRTRTGTTPVRQKENSAVADFGRLFAKEQAREDERRNSGSGGGAAASDTTTAPTATAAGNTTSTTNINTTTAADVPRLEPEVVATECVLYGYPSKSSEWKVLSKFERIVAPSYICEDYPREDPNLMLMSSSNSPATSFARSAIVLHRNLAKDALKKSAVYRGGQHWIKVTFESFQAAERACHYSPVEIDGCMVHCEMWQGRPPADLPVPRGTLHPERMGVSRTLGPAHAKQFMSGKDSAIAGFEKAMTLPRSMTLADVQYGQPQDDLSITSTTASSATATATATGTAMEDASARMTGLRSRSVPQLPSQAIQSPTSQFMTHIPSVKKAVLRPISEALPPQPTFVEKVLRSLPIVSWFVGSRSASGEMIGEGPLLKEDGAWDERNGWYWSIWFSIDRMLGTDFCGLRDD